MSSFDYTKTAATATRLLLKFGRAATLTRVAPGAYDPATGAPGAGSTALHAGTAALFDYQQKDIDGTHVRMGDQRAYIAPDLAATPQTGDTLTIGSDVWSVIASRPLAPAGTVVLHEAQVRR
ncbi:hypothetical protein METUNv1_01685 [Methyloversatilis universalis FAM5]|uniref:Phage protein n=1 Tax=Methyloversatilis universalis (strain ATCC BAA-1314 / DSM 25237 / JCM 13912 / CCUG 52030 / FAM5) TaxID=1000565 RepID=F5RC44_METUF|nr:hypothetical protein [Methyloversatilis universalis]EGK71907.1 hypothetical protein METUNv1_01685 [Methyloversatilis universalis FAM5]